MSSRLIALLSVAALVLLGLCAVFVYPTLYEYTRKGEDVWRVNRFSGVKEMATSDGWRTEKQVEDKLKAEAEKLAEQDKDKADEEARKTAPKDLPEFRIGADEKVHATCSISYADDSLKYNVELKPYLGELETAVSDSYAQHELTVEFDDKDGFKVEEYHIPLSSFSRTVIEGQPVGMEYRGVEPMAKERYETVSAWLPKWNW